MNKITNTRRAAGVAARHRLIDRHSSEYHDLLNEELVNRGLEPELTTEEKAEKKLRELLATNPNMVDRFEVVVDEVAAKRNLSVDDE